MSPNFIVPYFSRLKKENRTNFEDSHYYAPTDIVKLYNFPRGLNGKNQTIGIIELGGGYRISDLEQNFSKLGIIPQPTILSISVDGGNNDPTGNPDGPDAQVMVDILVTSEIASGAKIVVYFAPNSDRGFFDAINTAIHDTINRPSVILISWGNSEDSWTSQLHYVMNKAFLEAAALGITVCCASSINFSKTDDTDSLTRADFPASNPFVLACGGTQLKPLDGSISCETSWNFNLNGIGVSNIFEMPPWQAKTNVPQSISIKRYGGRGVPDVAANADPSSGYKIYLGGMFLVYGGTGAAAALWASLISLIDQDLSKRLGFINSLLYNRIAPIGILRYITPNDNIYSATANWNASTGLGSPDGSKLLRALKMSAHEKYVTQENDDDSIDIDKILPRQSAKQKIEKYVYMQFPEKVVLNSVDPLVVMIKAAAPTKGFTQKIKLIADLNETEVEIQVTTTSSAFEVEGKYYSTISIPIKEIDSEPVIFMLRPKKEGLCTLKVNFLQEGNYVAGVKLSALVLPNESEVVPPQLVRVPNESKVVPPQLKPPDLTILVYTKTSYPSFEYDLIVITPDTSLSKLGIIRLKDDPETVFRTFLQDIENSNLPPSVIDARIRSIGLALYDELFPASLKELYWKKRNSMMTIQFISDDPWIPWEIIKPWNKLPDNTIQEDPFLCEQFAVSRWLSGFEVVSKEKVKSLEIFVPSDIQLTSTLDERNWIRQFGMHEGLEVSVHSSYDDVLNALERGNSDVLHFSTHARYDEISQVSSAIELENGLVLRPDNITGRATTFGSSHPLILINTCQSSTQGFHLSGIQTWAMKFLRAGASVFIGTLWSVSDKTALKFTMEFYRQLSMGTPLAEAVRRSRNYCKQYGDPSWLAYQLYGQPQMKVYFGNSNNNEGKKNLDEGRGDHILA